MKEASSTEGDTSHPLATFTSKLASLTQKSPPQFANPHPQVRLITISMSKIVCTELCLAYRDAKEAARREGFR